MKEKLLMILGLSRVIVGDDYVGESYRRELKRFGRKVLKDLRVVNSS